MIDNNGCTLVVKRSSIHGYGCYAGAPIPAGAFIVEYKGELIPAKEAYRREQDATRPGIYTFWVADEWAIDGLLEGNVARFINHSCTPNCQYRIQGLRVMIYAGRDIAADEELTFDYRYSAEGEKVACSCGSPGCRGCINAVDDDGP
jgi:SET domain-containing protein